jgi:tRNA1Val (adenine37-N6)-methyltransferase
MPNPVFHFKQFTIHQERCAMKVGTDAVLLGSWVQPPQGGCILDVGTGTGIIALMVAQRCHADILGIDVDQKAVEQATENFSISPWANRLHAEHRSFQDQVAQNDKRWDLILSNPPYFNQSYQAPEESRNLARHTILLDLETLIVGAASALTPKGSLSLILPAHEGPQAMELAERNGLFRSRCTEVITRPGKTAKRWLMQWTNYPGDFFSNQLILEADGRHLYSDAFKLLTRDFYLNG